MPSALTTRLAVFAALLVPLHLGCTQTCPKDKLERGAAFVRDVCAIQPLISMVYLRPGAPWAGVDLPAAALSDGIALALYTSGLEYNLRPLDLDDLKEEVEKARMLADNQDMSWSGRALLTIAADVPAGAIYNALDLLHGTGFSEVHLVAEARGGPALPSLLVPAVAAELDARTATISEDISLPYLAARRELLIAEEARCPQLTKAFEAPSSLPYAQRCTGLGEGIIAACDACRCRADVERVLSLAMHAMVPPALTVARITTRAPDAIALTAASNEVWSDLAPRLFTTPGPAIHLKISP